MPEPSSSSNPFFTTFLTVISGVFVLAIGQIIQKLWLEPLLEQKKVLSEIANSLLLYANIGSRIEDMYFRDIKLFEEMKEHKEDRVTQLKEERIEQHIKNEWERTDAARKHQRLLASQLLAATNAIPLYPFWAVLFGRPSPEQINEGSRLLIGLSNNSDAQPSNIAKCLRMKIVTKRLG